MHFVIFGTSQVGQAWCLAQILDAICVSFRGHHRRRNSNPMIFCRCFFVFTITIGWFQARARGVLDVFPGVSASGFRFTDARFRGRARGVWEVFSMCPRADSALQMPGFGVTRGLFWRSSRCVRERIPPYRCSVSGSREGCLGGLSGVSASGFRFTDAGFCLLYTSPSPRDLSTSRMPSSA